MFNTSFQSMHTLHSSGDYYVSSCHKSSAGLLVRFQNSILVLIKTYENEMLHKIKRS